jgi:carbonic anhydrase
MGRLLLMQNTPDFPQQHGFVFLSYRDLKPPKAVSATTPFGYTNRLSALNWQNLDPAYALCATGIYQSPIDLNSTIPFAPANPKSDLTSPHPILQNTGVLVEVAYPSVNGTTCYANRTWQIDNFHFHTPGEHRVLMEFFPAEIHIVHHDISTSPLTLLN